MKLLIRILVLLTMAGAASACTVTSAGEPRRTTDVPATDPSEESSRPREIRLDDVDPCGLIPESDYPDFHMSDPGKPDENDGEPECIWPGTEVGYFSISLIMSEGVDALFEDRYGKAEETDPVDDFPAYQITLPDDDGACFVAVDVARGQHLLVQVGLDNPPASNQPSVCEYAHQFASSAMSTLVES